jgi:hypothetical protein
MSETTATLHSTRTLSSFAADLRYGDLPNEVVMRTEEYFLDWVASAADHGDGATPEELRRLVDRAWNLANEDDLRDLLPGRTDNTRLRAYGAKRRNGSW